MTKSELKTGMRVQLRNGNKYLVLKDCETCYGHQDFCLVKDGGWIPGSEYDEDLLSINVNEKDYDIVAIYSFSEDAANSKNYVGRTVLDMNRNFLIFLRMD